MGCVSSSVYPRKILPLPLQLINQFIDSYPTITLYKLKNKFDSHCDLNSFLMTCKGFERLYAGKGVPQGSIHKLFGYFTDMNDQPLRFKYFTSKYAIITKCDEKLFHKFLFYLYKNYPDIKLLIEEEYDYFIKNHQIYFATMPPCPTFPIGVERFSALLVEHKFNVNKCQYNFVLVTEKDLPYEEITRYLLLFEESEYIPGYSYYVISLAWYYRWTYYYRDCPENYMLHSKSTKLAIRNDRQGARTRRNTPSNRRGGTLYLFSRRNSHDISVDLKDNILIEQPVVMYLDDIEGEYVGYLKEKIKITTQCKILNSKLWELFSTLYPAEQAFKRIAIATDNLYYYPKSIYYCEINELGKVKYASQNIIMLPNQSRLKDHFEKDSILFAKNFNDLNWKKLDLNSTICTCSFQPRFFLAKVDNYAIFQTLYSRTAVSNSNLTLGDTAYAFFDYENKVIYVYIISLVNDLQCKIHYRGYSYRYYKIVTIEYLNVIEYELKRSKKSRAEGIMKGISNVGNTCFINSVAQCLFATPILTYYFEKYIFIYKRQSVLYNLSQMAKQISKNYPPDAPSFKKCIDVHMPLFSGYEQHDAQEFLNYLLDRLNSYITDKPTIIDYLYTGKINSELTCLGCGVVKNLYYGMHILSLPIPYPEYNIFSIILIPVSTNAIMKILLKLHRNATVADYLKAFEYRISVRLDRHSFLFCYCNYRNIRKSRSYLLIEENKNKRIMDIGIVSNMEMYAYEKLPKEFYAKMVNNKYLNDEFIECKHPSENYWSICKVIDRKQSEIIVNFLKNTYEIEKIAFTRKIPGYFARLGCNVNEFCYKKMYMRKFNVGLRKMELFGIDFVVGIPKWANFSDVEIIVDKFMDNLVTDSYKKYQTRPYIIRLLYMTKLKCIFCDTNCQNISYQALDEVTRCCKAYTKYIPLLLGVKYKNYSVFIDWTDISRCNSVFCSYSEMDDRSKQIEYYSNTEKIELEDCIQLHQKPYYVDMICYKCKYPSQRLKNIISVMPNILVLHMKEFRYTSYGHLIKLDVRLRWQYILDSSKYSMEQQGKMYEFFAFVRHSGSSEAGHYTCMVKKKHPYKNRKVWVNFDDYYSEIVKYPQKNIDNAYLLFYKKVDMPTSMYLSFTSLGKMG